MYSQVHRQPVAVRPLTLSLSISPSIYNHTDQFSGPSKAVWCVCLSRDCYQDLLLQDQHNNAMSEEAKTTIDAVL